MPVGSSFKLKDKRGTEHTLYYKESIAYVTGVPVHTLTLWDKQSILPATPFRDNGQRKLYTAEHIAAIDKVLSDELQTCGISDINKEHLKSLLTERFKKINASLAQKFKGVKNYETEKEVRRKRRSK
ncbi:MAG: MerR family transcriptional regulator [Oscillospiraceae bacterium]|jgi:DNA-binding transcriptional MerR regulator|nr:MerR family transcriptional regulator [Oscillospiraceae bacterium]